jgi:glutaredoxin
VRVAVTLTIYTMMHCPTCVETRRVAAAINARHRDLMVRLINLDQTPALRPPAVFSVPTYVLDGTVISLGNPYLEDLDACIRLALAEG